MASFDNQTLRERVYAHLKQEILDNRIPPGALLQEVPLAQSLGISRGPIREALSSLAAEGLVTITPRRGAVVRELTKHGFMEAYQLREALEALAVRLAVPVMTEAELDSLERPLADMQRFAETNDGTSFFDANRTFHEVFIDASRNSILIEAYSRLIGQMAPYRGPSALLRGSLDRSIAEHRGILAAARSRDTERTATLVVEHIRVPQARLEALSEEAFALESRLSAQRLGPPHEADEPKR
ncbi:MAG: GntR family transcriptional regulator [Chloroflexota bacterium]